MAGSFIDDLFGKLFPKKQPLNVKENFTRSEGQQAALEEWLDGEEGAYYMDLIQKNYHFKTSGMSSKPEVHLLRTPYANGFAVTYESPLTPEAFSHIFFALGRKIKAMGYRQVSLDRKMREINNQVQTTEKYYFKPPLSAADLSEKIDQLYGNISVEKITVDDKPSFLKLMVTVYSDHLYQEARSFDDFIEVLFEK
ncbi:hypothetical protein A3SI_15663 [Nitritalea halalkaliphila LW7]|uniref:Uncharacterized protein n=1 Tax=Nitritalea halalkaliphila LW7 TaxID=1189621 RepID=I5BYB3_9BACT|nr:hypothetical protein [Nitritalea halalkaliphila]EIM74565.1 hypothetical protein A3SI_15663 [Nitritalea halalkaliphila LW7]